MTAGTPRAAIPPLLAILSQNPDLVRVRLELAHAYFLAEQWSQAREQFFIVLSGDIPAPVRANVLAFLRAIDNRRSVDWDFDISLTQAGDLRSYDTDEVTLNLGGASFPATVDRTGSSGVALRLRSAVEARVPTDTDIEGLGALSAFGRLSIDSLDAANTEFDDATLTARFGLRAAGATTTTTLSPYVARRFIATSAYESRAGLSLSSEYRVANGAFVSGALGFARIDNLQSTVLDGHETQLDLRYVRSVKARSYWGVAFSFKDTSLDAETESALSRRLTVFGAFDGTRALRIEPSIFIGDQRHRAQSPLFVDSADEQTVGASLRIEHADPSRFGGFAPYLRVAVERNSADMRANSFREQTVAVGLVRRF